MLPLHSTNNKANYTCLSCQIEFPSTELQRTHMKTEWHRYNLKRRVALLAPVSNEIFQLKVLNSKDSVKYDVFGFVIEDEKVKDKDRKSKKRNLKLLLNHRRGRLNNLKNDDKRSLASRDPSPANSEISEISTFSLGTLKSHSEFEESDFEDLKSEISKNYETDYQTEEDNYNYSETDETDEEEDIDEKCDPLKLSDCFYCGTKFEDLNNNVKHMLLNHGLYIPDLKYLNDKEGLIRLLSDTVVLNKECIKCGYHSRKLLGIRQHIVAKGHACIPYETKEEKGLFNRFYDFTKLHLEKADSEEEEEEEGEYNTDDYTRAVLDSSGVELSLPNGNKLGHRSMIKYYRQNFPRKLRTLSEGEQTISILNKENEKLLKLQEVSKHNKEVKNVSLINMKISNKQLSKNGLQYRNNLENYRNQRFG